METKITELNLMEFGFKKNYEPSNTNQAWYYYTRQIGDVCLISNSNDEVGEDDSWHIRLFECDTILVKDKTRLRNLIHAIIQVTV
jgi:hypothetical protein